MLKVIHAFLLFAALLLSQTTKADPADNCVAECNTRVNTSVKTICEENGLFGKKNLGQCIAFIRSADDVYFGQAPIALAYRNKPSPNRISRTFTASIPTWNAAATGDPILPTSLMVWDT